MKATGNPQINTRVYWNYIYTTPAKRKEYWVHTNRFPLAVSFVKDNDRFIDLGCGVGLPGRMVKEKHKGCEVWGVDISSEIIEQNKIDDPGTKYFQGYIGALDFLPLEYFDVVFAGEVIEHLDNPMDLFRDAYKILRKGGKLIITTPIKDGVDSPEHVWYFEKDDIEKFYRDAGFNQPEFKGLPNLEYKVVFFAIGEK